MRKIAEFLKSWTLWILAAIRDIAPDDSPSEYAVPIVFLAVIGTIAPVGAFIGFVKIEAPLWMAAVAALVFYHVVGLVYLAFRHRWSRSWVR